MDVESVSGTAGHATWAPTWSAYMLEYLANLVVSGTKTSSTFKMVHYNGCAKALQQKFGIVRSGDQVKNHLKTWQKKFRKDHKGDADFLNKPIQHFVEMNTIFGSTMATGRFAKDSSVPLGTQEESTDDWDTEVQRMEVQSDRGATQDDNVATSSASKATNPKKKDKGKKRARTDQDPLVAAIKWGSVKLAKAIKEAGKSDNDVPSDLYDNVMGMPGFNSTHLSFYHSYLVQNPHIARAFNSLPFEHKLNWVAKHIADNYPDAANNFPDPDQ
ncbi:hypothetical protein BDA96_10G131500 [Sorghum bicolor]|uniref:Myb/SANT-like domain-containing protein n=1 Tax=Sorghum bicolor TaxID=4558 RepID=A0A921U0J3_SORBI|nr:hypothetical protein BDA96_10G131500 [Sorghum bicolor]